MATPEQVVGREKLNDRLSSYIPSEKTLESCYFPRLSQISLREKLRADLTGANYVLTYSHTEGKLVIVPPWHDLNTSLLQSPGKDYGHAVFEGISAEPIVSQEGELQGANVILLAPRMRRLEKSIITHGFDIPVKPNDIKQGILDLVSILGPDIFETKTGEYKRAYIRPSVARGQGRFGVSMGEGQQIDMSVLAWNWPYYLPDPERVYRRGGLQVAAFTNEQRLSKIYAKEAANYGHSGIVAKRARLTRSWYQNNDEALLFGPYTINPANGKPEREVINQMWLREELFSVISELVISDGPGEEVVAITPSGELWYPPMNVNRLGGTTLSYVVNYLAPNLGIPVRERAFCLKNIQLGDIATLIFMGNAARIAPIGLVTLYDEKDRPLDTYDMDIHPTAKDLVNRFEDEVAARVNASGRELLSFVDLNQGLMPRRTLDGIYSNWF